MSRYRFREDGVYAKASDLQTGVPSSIPYFSVSVILANDSKKFFIHILLMPSIKQINFDFSAAVCLLALV